MHSSARRTATSGNCHMHFTSGREINFKCTGYAVSHHITHAEAAVLILVHISLLMETWAFLSGSTDTMYWLTLSCSRMMMHLAQTSALHGLLAVRGVPNTEDASGGPGQSGQCTVDVHVCV